MNGTMRLLFAIAAFLLVFMIINGSFCEASAGPLKASIEITSEIKVSKEKSDDIINFGERSSHYDIPPGYQVAAVGKYKINPVTTIRCSYEDILKQSMAKCLEKNYHGFCLVNLKKPNIVQTCYQADIVFLIALH